MDQRSKPKYFTGTVLSNKMAKTIVVKVLRKKKHPKYGKYFTVMKKYKVDCSDERLYPSGSEVIFTPCKPISKEKRFRVLQKQTEKLTS